MSGDHLAGAIVGVYSFVVGQKLRFLWGEIVGDVRGLRWAGRVVMPIVLVALALVWPLWPLADVIPSIIGRREDFKCKTCGWLVGARWRWLTRSQWKWHRWRSPACDAAGKPTPANRQRPVVATPARQPASVGRQCERCGEDMVDDAGLINCRMGHFEHCSCPEHDSRLCVVFGGRRSAS